MTGSGTQADPYIPTTWAEFVTAIGTSSAYVSVPEGTVWDMNEIQPTGYSSAIEWKALRVDGNNAQIKNLYFYSTGRFIMPNANYAAIYNIKFLNFLIEDSALVDTSAYYNYSVPFYSCSFSGKLINGALSKSNSGNDNNRQISFRQCSMNLELSGNSAIFNTYSNSNYFSVNAQNCNLKVSGTSTRTNTCQVKMQNCLWTGDMPTNLWLQGYTNDFSQYNIFDANIGASRTVTGTTWAMRGNIVNSDKIVSGATVDSAYSRVNSAQLRDASYLASIGFPIAT